MTDPQIETYRKDTAGCAGLIHFNNAGTSLPPDVVLAAVIDYLIEEATFGGYETESKYATEIDGVYESVARLINAHADEIALMENASAAWGTAFKGLGLKAGDEIITSELEYTSNLVNLIDARKAGVQVIVLDNDLQGNFPLARLEMIISERTRLIAVTHIGSTGGGMLPIHRIGQIARRHQVPYLVDACQSVGQCPIDVQAIGCDLLSATGRKYLRAPRGTGFLYVRKSFQERVRPLLLDQHGIRHLRQDNYDLRPDARRFELYEKNRALLLGLGRAADYALAIGLNRIWIRIEKLAAFTRKALSELPGITVQDTGSQLCGIVTFSAAGRNSMVIKNRLLEGGINVSWSGPDAALLYMTRRQLGYGVVRASLHYYNTEEEILQFIQVLKNSLKDPQ